MYDKISFCQYARVFNSINVKCKNSYKYCIVYTILLNYNTSILLFSE